MAPQISITRQDDQIIVNSPYHPDFPPRARQMDGRWDGDAKTWVFDARTEEAVRDLCRKIYGTDGTEADLVTVRVTAPYGWSQLRNPIVFAGRIVATARGRDSGAKTGDGVVMLAGEACSGGSVKNWITEISRGAVVEIRDLPRPAVEMEIEKQKNQGWGDDELQIEIVESTINLCALQAEREKLLARIAEIDDILSRLIDTEE